MKLVLHGNGLCDGLNRIKKQIETQLPWIQLHQVYSVQELAMVLGRPLHGVSTVVSYVTCESQILALSDLLLLLDRSRLVLILPRSSDRMLELGLRLSPSFVTYPDSDEVIIVLEKLYLREKNSIPYTTYWHHTEEENR